MGIKVCKFGGTSMADGNIILSSAKIVTADDSRRYIVVSAPGKRFSGDVKVTDLLYACYDAYEQNNRAVFEETYERVCARFYAIEREIGKDLQLAPALQAIKQDILDGAGKEYSWRHILWRLS